MRDFALSIPWLALSGLLLAASASADIVWTGAVSSDIFDEANCEFTIPVDLSALPVWRKQAALQGETWSFQAWLVDGASSNFTDGVAITFL